MNAQSQYLDYVSKNYFTIRDRVNKESLKLFRRELDEDVFHDTLLKCDKKFDKDDKQIINYIFISYKTNYLRELEYARNKNKEDVEVNDLELLDRDCDLTDYTTIQDLIINKFGEHEWDLFEEYIAGNSISDISKNHKEKGLYYRFNKIKLFTKRYISK